MKIRETLNRMYEEAARDRQKQIEIEKTRRLWNLVDKNRFKK